MSRSDELERDILIAACKRIRLDSESAERAEHAVMDRLTLGAQEYGDDSWREKSVATLLGEAAEEGADGPAWILLAVQKAYEEQRHGLDLPGDWHDEAVNALAGFLSARFRLEKLIEQYRAATPPPKRRPTAAEHDERFRRERDRLRRER